MMGYRFGNAKKWGYLITNLKVASVGIRVYPGPKFTALVNSYHFGNILRTIKTQEIPHTFVLYVYTPRVLPTSAYAEKAKYHDSSRYSRTSLGSTA